MLIQFTPQLLLSQIKDRFRVGKLCGAIKIWKISTGEWKVTWLSKRKRTADQPQRLSLVKSHLPSSIGQLCYSLHVLRNPGAEKLDNCVNQ